MGSRGPKGPGHQPPNPPLPRGGTLTRGIGGPYWPYDDTRRPDGHTDCARGFG